ncbi:MAG TPA: sigma 54-interacting transcriptional regulator [Pyrinomonadaceae bacterium]|nr:sigma 54-interacting transcriptional regulator [Pyrinomonadaceae bacterium]
MFTEMENVFSIGRTTENDLIVPSAGVSRRHCEIRFENSGYIVFDNKSHNGTYVNNRLIKEKILSHGDTLRIGNRQFIFFIEEVEANEHRTLFDDAIVTKSELSFLSQSDFAHAVPHLDTLVKLGIALDEAESADFLQKKFLEILLQNVPANRAAILFFDEAATEPTGICVVGNTEKDIKISRTVCDRVRHENIALLSNDLIVSDLNMAESLVFSGTKALLAVPFSLGNDRSAIIYLDTDDEQIEFSEANLQQITAVSFLLSAALQQKFLISDLQSENRRLHENLNLETDIIGESRGVQKVLEMTAKVSKSDSSVLIRGESGTGKELIAKAIHHNSARRHKPFIAVNCAVLNENLIESELFGHEKGSFTGAITQKKGKFELAEGGTIFLDEIGELSPVLQAKLLRVLQEKEFERVGGSQTIKTNVRVISATHRDLKEEINSRSFRDDLFFRLSVVEIKMPPLRDRKTDILILVKHFIEKHRRNCNRKITGLSNAAREILLNYEWRGNVRELENAIERALVVGTTEQILAEDLPEQIIEFSATQNINLPSDYHQQVKAAKQNIIIAAIQKASGNYSEAARSLGINPNNLHRIVRELGIKEKL